MSSPTSRSLLRAAIGPADVGFRRFWLATSVSVLGTWMAAIALSIRMYDVTGSPGWVSALLFAELTPTVLTGFLFGHRLDRLRVRRSLVACDLAGAAVFAALALIDTPWVVVVLAGLAGAAAGVFRPLATAAVPLIVDDDDLEAATGAIGSADNAMTFLGEVLGGVLVGSIGASPALALNAVSFAGSALLISTCTVLARRGSNAPSGRVALHARASLARIRRSPVLRQIAVGWTIATVVLGVVAAVQVPLLRGSYRASPAVVGLVLGLGGVGLVAGSMVAGSRRFGRAAYPLSLAGIGSAIMIAGASQRIALAAFGLTVLGLFNGVAVVLNRSRVVRGTDPSERAGLISFLIALTATGQVVGTIMGGVVATATSPRWAFVIFGSVALLIAAPVALSVGPRPEWNLDPSPWASEDEPPP